MNEVPRKTEQATRRQFLRRSVGGASLFGLGSATGLLAFPTQAQQAAATGGGSGGRRLPALQAHQDTRPGRGPQPGAAAATPLLHPGLRRIH